MMHHVNHVWEAAHQYLSVRLTVAVDVTYEYGNPCTIHGGAVTKAVMTAYMTAGPIVIDLPLVAELKSALEREWWEQIQTNHHGLKTHVEGLCFSNYSKQGDDDGEESHPF
jgi:hypothetical protein